MASDVDELFRIVASPCGRFKLAKLADCSRGYGAAATATFIRHRTSLLAGEIQHARAVWLKSRPSAAQILEQFPQIAGLCVEADVGKYVAEQGLLTPLSAAVEIMHGLFPTYSVKSIARMARAPRGPWRRP